jgi:hypothetical protein
MALRERGRVLRITASGGGTLACPSYESLRVRNIHCVPSANDSYLTLSIDGMTVLKLRVKGKSGNHCPYPVVNTASVYEAQAGTIFDLGRRLGKPLDVPIGPDQTLTIARYAEAGELTVVYDAFDAGDVRPEEPNGSMARVRRYPHYMTNSAAITATPCVLDTSLIWTSFEPWPVASSKVPDGATIRLLAILGAPASHGDATNNKGYTTALQLIQEGRYLFDVSQVGLPLVGLAGHTANTCVYTPVASVIGPLTAEQPQPPFIPEVPLEFKPGETLTAQVKLTGAAANGLIAADLDIAFLLERELAA